MLLNKAAKNVLARTLHIENATWLKYLVNRKTNLSQRFRPFQGSSFIPFCYRCQISLRGAEGRPLFSQPVMDLQLKSDSVPRQSWLEDSEAIRPEKTGWLIFLLYFTKKNIFAGNKLKQSTKAIKGNAEGLGNKTDECVFVHNKEGF